jgi:hypothetical protein
MATLGRHATHAANHAPPNALRVSRVTMTLLLCIIVSMLLCIIVSLLVPESVSKQSGPDRVQVTAPVTHPFKDLKDDKWVKITLSNGSSYIAFCHLYDQEEFWWSGHHINFRIAGVFKSSRSYSNELGQLRTQNRAEDPGTIPLDEFEFTLWRPVETMSIGYDDALPVINLDDSNYSCRKNMGALAKLEHVVIHDD